MPRLRPFSGHVVAAARADAVVAPPYDALTPQQRAAMAAADPDSFLNALPPAGPEATDDLERTLAACRRSVDRLIAAGRFSPLSEPSLAVMAIGADEDRTVAIVGDLPGGAFTDAAPLTERVMPHEQVEPARVDQLARYLEVVGVASSPVAVTHRPHAEVARATATIVERPTRLAFRSEDGTDIAVWIVEDPAEQAPLIDAVQHAGRLYVADGHHRAAALDTYAGRRRAEPDSSSAQVLTAVIPSDRLQVLPFHRRLVGLSNATIDGVLSSLRDRGIEPSELDGPWQPDRTGVFALTVEGRWWSIDLSDRAVDGAVEGLDVRLAEREIVEPLLDDAAATEPTADTVGAASARAEPVAVPAGLDTLVLPGTVGVALPPPGVEAILDVADAEETMPPKTTYVTPKLRSGLFLTPR